MKVHLWEHSNACADTDIRLVMQNKGVLTAESSHTQGAKQICDAGQHIEQILLMNKLKLQVLLPKQ